MAISGQHAKNHAEANRLCVFASLREPFFQLPPSATKMKVNRLFPSGNFSPLEYVIFTKQLDRGTNGRRGS